MGYTRLLTFLYRKFTPEELDTGNHQHQRENDTVQHLVLAIDANYLIYTCIRLDTVKNASGDDEMIENLTEGIVKKLVELIKHHAQFLKNLKILTVYVAFDGESPKMKSKCQEKRRENHESQHDLSDELKHLLKNLNAKGKKMSCAMDLLREKLKSGEHFLERFECSDRVSMSGFFKLSTIKMKIFLSDHRLPGEGEIKLLNYVMEDLLPPESSTTYNRCLQLVSVDTDVLVSACIKYSKLANIYKIVRVRIAYGPYGMPNFCVSDIFKIMKIDERNSKMFEPWFIAFILVGNDYLPTVISLERMLNSRDKMTLFEDIVKSFYELVTERRGNFQLERDLIYYMYMLIRAFQLENLISISQKVLDMNDVLLTKEGLEMYVVNYLTIVKFVMEYTRSEDGLMTIDIPNFNFCNMSLLRNAFLYSIKNKIFTLQDLENIWFNKTVPPQRKFFDRPTLEFHEYEIPIYHVE